MLNVINQGIQPCSRSVHLQSTAQTHNQEGEGLQMWDKQGADAISQPNTPPIKRVRGLRDSFLSLPTFRASRSKNVSTLQNPLSTKSPRKRQLVSGTSPPTYKGYIDQYCKPKMAQASHSFPGSPALEHEMLMYEMIPGSPRLAMFTSQSRRAWERGQHQIKTAVDFRLTQYRRGCHQVYTDLEQLLKVVILTMDVATHLGKKRGRGYVVT